MARILTVLGARPNFNKEMLINRLFAKAGIEEIIAHTGQHYDHGMSGVFFKELGIPKPSHFLSAGGENGALQIARIIERLFPILAKEKPDATLVYGDVNSTSAAAIASARAGVEVFHIEAGVRSQYLYNPEEINRRIADHLSVLNFAPTKEAHSNLLSEGFGPKNAIFTGDVLSDSLDFTLKQHGISPVRGGYILATIHREENRTAKRLSEILSGLASSKRKVVLPLHPGTKKAIADLGLLPLLSPQNISVLEPQGYVDFTRLLAGADKVVTDSGGVRREAYLLGKPCIVPIDIVWFPEIVSAGWMKIVNQDRKEIAKAISEFEPAGARPEIFGNGHAAEKIVEAIKLRLNGRGAA